MSLIHNWINEIDLYNWMNTSSMVWHFILYDYLGLIISQFLVHLRWHSIWGLIFVRWCESWEEHCWLDVSWSTVLIVEYKVGFEYLGLSPLKNSAYIIQSKIILSAFLNLTIILLFSINKLFPYWLIFYTLNLYIYIRSLLLYNFSLGL